MTSCRNDVKYCSIQRIHCMDDEIHDGTGLKGLEYNHVISLIVNRILPCMDLYTQNIMIFLKNRKEI